MAIQFARCAYVSRSTGGNACRKAAYNQREDIRCERTGELFSFKERGGNVHHEILLPENVHKKFRNSSALWNEAEQCEKRKDSQVAKEFVLALPDDAQVTLEDRIELTRRFVQEHFVEKGLGIQIDIHEPDKEEKNWHAHVLVTTRRFSEDGLSFEKTKARDLDPTIKKGFVVEADVWGEHWRDLQNTYFEEKGYDLRVDPIGIVPQEHLGPVRMRHHMNEVLARAQALEKANEELARDPGSVLESLTRHQAVFSEKDIDHFLKKYVDVEHREQAREGILNHPSLLSLYDKETGDKTLYFTTKDVRAEEEKLLRFADSVGKRSVSLLSPAAIEKGMEGRAFSEEQHKAYELCVNSGQNLSLIQGRAGVGKSYVLNAVRMAHEENGYRVIGLAPTHKVANDLQEGGFKHAKTCHSFLFALKHRKMTINANTLIVIDEAGMLSTELSVELFHAAKTRGAKLVLVGDDRQLSSVERGGAFRALLDRYESTELKEVRRQTISWQKAVSEDLSRGDVKSAVQILHQNNRIDWKDTREEALSSLLKAWAEDRDSPLSQKHIITQKNVEVDALNLGVRDTLRAQGKLGDVELSCMTSRGKTAFAVGDRIQLTKTDKTQGLMNQQLGMVEHINEAAKTLTIYFDNGEKKEIDPRTYDGLRHGYASTVYKAQGSTLDYVYVLHSNTTNQATNYVSLTRQTKSLSLFVSKDETATEAHLIRQMSREEGKGTSLAFDTQKDIARCQEDKTFKTHIRDGVETLVTKVKDVFHKNEAFYQVDKTLTQTNGEVHIISPALQAVYEEWKHPAFANATAIQQAFEKGLKIHGEEKAIAYWEGRKPELLQNYQKDLDKIEKELSSSLFSCRPDHWKEQARGWAKETPERVLNLIQKIKDDAPKQETRIPDQRIPKTSQPQVDPMEVKYVKFKALNSVVENNPNSHHSTQEELKQLGKELFQDKNFMEKIKLREQDEAQKIERIVQEKQRSFDRGRGGLSL
jgi:Ti-type conjugative transfer relaxase TraA